MSATTAQGHGAKPDEMPRVSIIVPTYRDWPRAQLCLDALARQSYPAERTEIFIVNNDPDDPPPDDLRVPDNCTVLTEAAKGSYAARNRGLAAASGDVMMFTDADCLPVDEWCKAMVACLQENPNLSRMGGRINMLPGANTGSVAYAYERCFSMEQELYVAQGWAATANMAAWTRVFAEIGPFEATHFSGGDSEWGLRAHRAGHAIGYCPIARIDHPARDRHEIAVKYRRIQGARLRRKLGAGGGVYATLYFVYHALRRILIPPGSPIARLAALSETPLHVRIATYFFVYYLRVSVVVDQARILFFKGAPERR